MPVRVAIPDDDQRIALRSGPWTSPGAGVPGAGAVGHPLRSAPDTVLTPHLAYVTTGA